MQEIQILKFKNNVNEIISLVISSHQTVLISDNNKKLVKIVPITHIERESSWLGCMKGTGVIKGDIVTPAEDTDVWEVFSE